MRHASRRKVARHSGHLFAGQKFPQFLFAVASEKLPQALSPKPLLLDITGGDLVHFSNMQLTLGGDAVNHFGYKPLQGVVRNFQ